MRTAFDAVAFTGPLVLAALGAMIGLAGVVRLTGSRPGVRSAAGVSRLHRVGAAAMLASLAPLAASIGLLLAAVLLWAARRS